MRSSRVVLAFSAAGVVAGILGWSGPVTAQSLPNWSLSQICRKDSAPGQCQLFEARARARVSEAWVTLPKKIQDGCLSEFRAPLEPSWRVMADCIGELSVVARVTVRKTAIERDKAVVRAIKERRVRAAKEAKESARRKAAAEAAAKAAERQAQLDRERAEREERRLADEEASFLTLFAALKKKERAEAAEKARLEKARLARQQSAEKARKVATAAAAAAKPATGAAAAQPAKPAAASTGGAATAASSQTAAAQPARASATPAPKAPETIKVEKPAEPARKAKPSPKPQKVAKVAATNREAQGCEKRLAETAAAGEVLFAFDSAELLKDAVITLDALAAGTRACGRVSVTIEGHTDSVGKPQYNQGLSERRAENVANYLINAGVPAKRVEYIGYGENRPVASNETDEGRAKNRRIEYRARAFKAQ